MAKPGAYMDWVTVDYGIVPFKFEVGPHWTLYPSCYRWQLDNGLSVDREVSFALLVFLPNIALVYEVNSDTQQGYVNDSFS